MSRKIETEAHAAEAILDRSLKIYLPAPLLLRIFGKKRIPFFIKRPAAWQLFSISATFVRMGIDVKELEATKEEAQPLFEDVGKHLRACCRIIATGMIRSRTLAFFLTRPLAAYLFTHADMGDLMAMARIIAGLSGAGNFVDIIRSVAYMRMTAPTLSHRENGS